MIDLQTVAQRLPVAVDAQRDGGLFQAVDKFALPFPAAEHAHVKAHIAVLFLQIKLTFAGHRHHVGLPLQAVQRHHPVIQRQLAAHGIQAGGIVVILLRPHVGAALHGLLHQLLEIQPLGTGIGHLQLGLPLPVTAEIIRVNARSGKLAGQRQLAGQV